MKGLPSGPVMVPVMEAPRAVALISAVSGSAAKISCAMGIVIS
jgi:hypothetical protein